LPVRKLSLAPGWRWRISEQEGYRPGVIVQRDEGNHAPGARTTILVPLATKERPFVCYVPVPWGAGTGLRADSWANCTQVFTVELPDRDDHQPLLERK